MDIMHTLVHLPVLLATFLKLRIVRIHSGLFYVSGSGLQSVFIGLHPWAVLLCQVGKGRGSVFGRGGAHPYPGSCALGHVNFSMTVVPS
jgi:hypothetical protein